MRRFRVAVDILGSYAFTHFFLSVLRVQYRTAPHIRNVHRFSMSLNAALQVGPVLWAGALPLLPVSFLALRNGQLPESHAGWVNDQVDEFVPPECDFMSGCRHDVILTNAARQACSSNAQANHMCPRRDAPAC